MRDQIMPINQVMHVLIVKHVLRVSEREREAVKTEHSHFRLSQTGKGLH
mgnify:CR=1 FL=1